MKGVRLESTGLYVGSDIALTALSIRISRADIWYIDTILFTMSHCGRDLIHISGVFSPIARRLIVPDPSAIATLLPQV